MLVWKLFLTYFTSQPTPAGITRALIAVDSIQACAAIPAWIAHALVNRCLENKHEKNRNNDLNPSIKLKYLSKNTVEKNYMSRLMQ